MFFKNHNYPKIGIKADLHSLISKITIIIMTNDLFLFRINIGKIDNLKSKRVTIILEDELDKKLRLLQAKLIQSTNASVIFSEVINETLKKSLK